MSGRRGGRTAQEGAVIYLHDMQTIFQNGLEVLQ